MIVKFSSNIYRSFSLGQILSADTIYTALEEKRVIPQQVNVKKDTNKSTMRIRQDRKRYEGRSNFTEHF